jgi:rubrerythrin
MFDAYLTEKEIKDNLVDFLLDWKNVRDPEVREKLTRLWTSGKPEQGSLLSELLIENNYSYVLDDKQTTLKTLNKEYFKGLLDQLSYREKIIAEKTFPILPSKKHYFEGNKLLQEAFLKVMEANAFSADTPLFEHQIRAIQAAIAKKDFLLSSGTGSGKTESFLLPALAKVFNETDEQRAQPGIRVLIIYPMNALINSQVTRLQSLIGVQDPNREPIRFALYNSKLKDSQNRFSAYKDSIPDYSQWPDLQVMDRSELRKTPPHILVTNYSMLEYALIRPKDLPLFEPERQKLHTIILDEAHTYIGAMAAEIAMLIRRVLVSFGKKSTDVQFFATSATIGDSKKDGGYILRKFASDLFSKDIKSIQYIDGRRLVPLAKVGYKKPITTKQLLDLLVAVEEQENKLQIIENLFFDIKASTCEDALYQIFTRNEDVVTLVNDLAKEPLTISRLLKKLHLEDTPENLHLAFLFVKYLGIIKSENPNKPLVKIRLHSVVEAPSGVYVCPVCGKYYGSYQDHCSTPACNKEPLLELVVCKKCGAPYLCAQEGPNGQLGTVEWYNRHIQNQRMVFKTLDGQIADSKHCLHCNTTNTAKDKEEEKDEEALSLDEEVTDPEVVFYKKVFFSPLSVSTDVIIKIAIDTLYANLEPHATAGNTWLPGEGRRLLTFTDNRQGAAKLPIALDWLHEVYLGNRLIYEAIKKTIETKKTAKRDIFNGFSENGQKWLQFFPANRPIFETLLSSLNTIEVGTITAGINQELSERPGSFTFIPEIYEKEDLVHDLLEGSLHEIKQEATFRDVQKTFENLPEIKELVGTFDQIEQENCWEVPSIRSKIAYWVMARSLGNLSPSKYLPENAGVCLLSFPLPQHFIEDLLETEAFRDCSTESVTMLVHAMLHRMRDTGSIFVDYPGDSKESKDDPIKAAADYCFQNTYVNKYMVLEHSMVPKDIGFINNWYNLNLSRDTAGIQIIKKIWDQKLLGIETARNMLATAWEAMTIKLDYLIKHPIYRSAYALDVRSSTISLEPEVCRCQECGRISPHTINNHCLTPSCKGVMIPLDRAASASLYGNKRSKNFPELGMRTVEHTAQLDLSQLTANERKFTEGTINLLSSSTTMELGIDIGGLTSIVLTNCPPGPSNYLQRAGRAGRRSDRVAFVLTCARKVPLDHYFFLHPDLFFVRKPHDPYVSLNSDKIVSRHLNSYILREFFTQLTREVPTLKISNGSNPLASYGTVKDFFGYEQHSLLSKYIVDYLLDWFDSDPDLPDLEFLLSGTDLVNSFNKESFLQEFKVAIHDKKELIRTYVEELDGAVEQESNDKRKAVLLYYKKELLDKDIVSFLIHLSLLPKYGFPVDVNALNTHNHQSKKPNLEENTIKRNQFRLERGSEIAIVEYAPGAKIIAGKHVLTSRGLSLDSSFGGESFSSKKNTLEPLSYVICDNCGHFYVLPSTNNTMPCPVCNAPIQQYATLESDEANLETSYNRPHGAFLPKGFRVDYSETQPFAPNKIDWNRSSARIFPELCTNPKNFIQIIPDLISIASSPSATFYAVNQGPNTMGYAICLSCGRSIPEMEYLGNNTYFKNHKRLYSDKPCGNQAISHNRSLVSRFVTDAIQIRFKKKVLPSYKVQENATSFVRTFARCLQLAAAKYLGLDDRELKFIVQNYWDPSSNGWDNLEIILYDNVPGGAGYADMIMHLFGVPDFYDILYGTTECPEECATACPACLIAYDKDENGIINYNRHLVRSFLEREDIKAFFKNYIGTIKPSAGDHTVYDIMGDISSVIRSKKQGKLELFFLSYPEDSFSVVGSNFGKLLEIAKSGIEVSLVFAQEPSPAKNLQLIENLRFGQMFAKENLHLFINENLSTSNLAACVAFGSHRFLYESFALPEQNLVVTPFSAFPFARRSFAEGTSPWIGGIPWKLPPNPTGMISVKTEMEKIRSIDEVHLWKLLCTKFSIDYAKAIDKVWYTDRYLLLYRENICFLMLLEDMPFSNQGEICLAVHGERESYSEFSFQERERQKDFLLRQMSMTALANVNLRMYKTTEVQEANCPGQAHDREMLIEFSDKSRVKLSFDSGMTMFTPYIDRNWKMDLESSREMIQRMQLSMGRTAEYSSSLIFKYSDKSEEHTLDKRFMAAIQQKALKLV